ncbi:hypothetical protein RRG08_019621 [Elysia crispata]|uniref:Uncharacterized protein n=1 Tax=Elysia crispata TaxID=231223 RepID=A0AAE1E628_9GAST|nr:hypothetical protein RRG08_019621 [Elysia crispata]
MDNDKDLSHRLCQTKSFVSIGTSISLLWSPVGRRFVLPRDIATGSVCLDRYLPLSRAPETVNGRRFQLEAFLWRFWPLRAGLSGSSISARLHTINQAGQGFGRACGFHCLGFVQQVSESALDRSVYRHSSQGFLKGDREEIKVEAIEEGNEEIAEEKIEEIDEKEFKEEIGRRIRKRRWTRRI